MARIRQQMFKQRTHPVWAGDFSGREHNLAGGAQADLADFTPDPVAQTTAAAAAAGDEQVTLTAAFGVALKEGDRIYDAAGPQSVIVAADVAADATVVAVRPLKKAIAAGASLAAVPVRKVAVPSGTLVGRTFAERAAGAGFGPADAADDEVYLVLFGSVDVELEPDIELYRLGSLVYENLLPEWGTMGAALQALVREKYEATIQTEEL